MLDNHSINAQDTRMIVAAPKAATARNKNIGVRFRSQKEIELIRRAAKAQNISFNTFVAEASATRAEIVLAALNGNSAESQSASQ